MSLRTLISETAKQPIDSRAAFVRAQLPPAPLVTDDDAELIAAVIVFLAGLYVWLGGSATAPTLAPVAPGPRPIAPQPPSTGPAVNPVPAGPTAPVLPSPTGGADQIDLSQAVIVGGAPDVRNWPITTSLTISALDPAIVPSFTDPGWPLTVPVGFEGGNIQFTVWAFAYINGQWVGSGFIQMWQGRPDCGAEPGGFDHRQQLAQNWWYYVPEMAGYYPAPGDTIGFMVTAGNERNGAGPWPVMERSNVVAVQV